MENTAKVRYKQNIKFKRNSLNYIFLKLRLYTFVRLFLKQIEMSPSRTRSFVQNSNTLIL
jgi:hypothetical protein